MPLRLEILKNLLAIGAILDSSLEGDFCTAQAERPDVDEVCVTGGARRCCPAVFEGEHFGSEVADCSLVVIVAGMGSCGVAEV